MKEVYLINPRKKRRKSAAKKKRVTRRSPAKRRTKKRTTKRVVARTTTTKTTKGATTMAKRRKRRTYKRNPTVSNPRRRRRAPSRARRAVSSVRSTFSGLNFKGALKNIPYAQIGMFGSKWLSKKFGGGADQTDPESWTWRNYLQGALGAAGAAFVMQMIRPGSGQRVLEGGLNLMVYEILQNELIQGSEWASGQFGQEEDTYTYQPGDVETDESGTPYMLGQDYQWRALPEEGVSGVLKPVGPLGETLQPVGPLGASDEKIRKALLGHA